MDVALINIIKIYIILNLKYHIWIQFLILQSNRQCCTVLEGLAGFGISGWTVENCHAI